MKITNIFTKDVGKCWIFTGGAAAAGCFSRIGCFRGCAGLVEEVIRWDMLKETLAERERFVFNTARPGLTVWDVLAEFEERVSRYRPSALVYLSGEEDRALDPGTFADGLRRLEQRAEEIGAGFLWLYAQDPLTDANAVLGAVGAPPSRVTEEDRKRYRLVPEQETFPQTGVLRLKDAPMRWLFIGDSITHGALHTRGFDSLPQLWEKYVREDLCRPDDTVINTGVSGATAKEFLDRLDIRYTPYADADVVVAMFGTNDCCFPDTDADIFLKRMCIIADLVHKNGGQLVIRTPQPVKPESGPRAEDMLSFVEAARQAADRCGAVLVDHFRNFDALRRTDPAAYDACMGDAIHPGPRGHYRMFREMAYAAGLCARGAMLGQSCAAAGDGTFPGEGRV